MFWLGTVNQNKALALIEFIFWCEDTGEEIDIREKMNMFSGVCAMRRMTCFYCSFIYMPFPHLNDYHVI